MRIQYASDLHLEFESTRGMLEIPNVDKKTDILVLAGDIVTSRKAKAIRGFWKWCADNFPLVIYVAGNHEAYHADIETFHDDILDVLTDFDNIRYLNNDVMDLGAYALFGGTLWTDCNNNDVLTKNTLRRALNDYRLISRKSKEHWRLWPEDTYEFHKETVEKMKKVLSRSAPWAVLEQKPTIVVSHHAPTRRGVDPRFAKDYFMNGGYSSNLEDKLLLPPGRYNIPLWLHGHCHNSYDEVIGRTRVTRNPHGYLLGQRTEDPTEAGYMAENREFDIRKVIELPEPDPWPARQQEAVAA